MLTNLFDVALGLGIAMGGPAANGLATSDPLTWPGNAPPEYYITLPVKNEIRGFFDLSRDAQGFMITARSPRGVDAVYRLRLSPAQRDQFNAFFTYSNFRPSGATEVKCLCDGIGTPHHHAVQLRWANLFWVDRR
jgi:hypothetical protein